MRIISPVLASGYRSGLGSGGQFFGTLHPHWEKLESGERAAWAADIGESLSASGVREVTLFDERRVLQMRYTDGVLTFVRPNEIAVAKNAKD